MIYPDYDTFKKLSENYEKITIYKEIFADTLNPVSLLINLQQKENLFLLESANIDKTFSRFSFIGFNPSKIILGINYYTVVNSKKEHSNIVDYITQNYPQKSQFIDKKFGDFAGGLIGYFGYEAVNFMDLLRKPIKISDNIHSLFFEIDEFFIFDNFKNKLYAAVCTNRDDNYDDVIEKLNFLINSISSISKSYYLSSNNYEIEKEYSDKEFLNKISAVKNEIINGEAIQVVLSRKFEINSNLNPVSLYRALRKINPSPYMFFVKHKDRVVLGSSPETHLKIKNNLALLKPIAGTYPVGKEKELLNDEKEHSEHLMLLDLARNDLYQGCKVDTVNVKKAFSIENYSHVIHIVYEVEGILRDDVTPFELFLKTFPAGTVSGAPKVRAIELINDYEDSERGFYSGCVGYLNYNHSLDTCITIRSALLDNNKAIFRAGAGIVADSILENELNEVNKKLEALFHSLKLVRKIEENHVFANW